MKIGVLGGNGLLGSKVLELLSKTEHEVDNITRNTHTTFMNKEYDIFINCNGNSKKYIALKNPLFDFYGNVCSTFGTIFDFKFKKYIYISSVDIYESHPYGIHKKTAEFLLHNYSTFLKFKLCVIRPTTIIGKGMTKGVIYDMLNDRSLYVNPESTFQFITNTELAKFIVKILNFSNEKIAFTLGGTTSIGISTIESLLNKKATFNKEPLFLQHYNYTVSKVDDFPLKTSEEYVKDYLNEH